MEEDLGAGIPEDDRPRVSPVAVAAGGGALWGVGGYTVLWEGEPFVVHRPFVESVAGTLVLLPVRAVLWAIHVAEDVAGRTFDLSTNHTWIAVAAAAIGAGVAAAVVASTRSALRRLRHAR